MSETMIDKRFDGRVSKNGGEDQYANGIAAKFWKNLLGQSRTKYYQDFLINLLKDQGCHRVLDIACGTGIDSIMLLESGFDVTSVDGSDKMLKYALKTRWNRRKDPKFDKWTIEEANWLTLYNDVLPFMGEEFDAVICLGNSFAHLLDSYGDQREHRQAFANFEKCLKPGGLLIIDHRNFDFITNSGATPRKNIYYDSECLADIKTSVTMVCGVSRVVTLDYIIDTSVIGDEPIKGDGYDNDSYSEFKLSYYPHKLEGFKGLIREAFGQDVNIKTYGDFQQLQENDNPIFYIHIVEKQSCNNII